MPPDIKKLIVSVSIPRTKPIIGPKYQPSTINGTQAIEIDRENGIIRIVNKPNTNLKAIKIAIKNNSLVERNDLIGEKGKKNFFKLNSELFNSF